MRRELNDIEYFNWCFGQPYNMVVVVQLRGELRPDLLREALAKAQRRHPLLQVNTEPGPSGVPWFSSEGVGAIPLEVVEQAGPDAARLLAERELTSTFQMGDAGAPRPPLMRVTPLLPRDPARPWDLVFTVQHVIADGLSMVFLVRDLLRFMEQPEAEVEVLDAPARDEDLLPARVRRRIPTTTTRFKIALALARLYVRLRYGDTRIEPKQLTHHHCSWELTEEQTARLRARCRQEGVSVQSAICAAFLSSFSAIHTPVNLRGILGRPVGESVGLFVGAAEVKMRYRPAKGFWGNARGFHRRLRGAMRDPFRIFRLFSKAVPVALVHQLGPLLMRMTVDTQPFAVTNLGVLDAGGVRLQGKDLKVESFFGAVTGIVDSSVATVYTIENRLRLQVLASEESPTSTKVREQVEGAVKLLLQAVEG